MHKPDFTSLNFKIKNTKLSIQEDLNLSNEPKRTGAVIPVVFTY